MKAAPQWRRLKFWNTNRRLWRVDRQATKRTGCTIHGYGLSPAQVTHESLGLGSATTNAPQCPRRSSHIADDATVAKLQARHCITGRVLRQITQGSLATDARNLLLSLRLAKQPEPAGRICNTTSGLCHVVDNQRLYHTYRLAQLVCQLRRGEALGWADDNIA